MDSQEIEVRQDSAMLLRSDMRSKKGSLNEANSKYRQISSNIIVLDEELKHATVRLAELQSGKGKSLASAPDIEVFEFWLKIPGYQGSIQNAKAEITSHGSLQHVSNVSSTSKSGLGGGIVGGLVFGPLGAAAGVLATRKNKVSTNIQKIDTRQVELQITGPGYAWSVLAHSGYSETFRQLRDLVNAYGSSAKNIQNSLLEQTKKVDSLKEKSIRLKADLNVAAKDAEERKLAYESTRKKFASTRLPLIIDLKFRWSCLSMFWKWVAILCGPAVFVILAGTSVYARLTAQPWLNEVIYLASANVFLWGLMFLIYLIRYRF